MFSGGDLGDALDGLFYAFVIAVGSAIVLAIYVFWQVFFGFTPWEICGRMETDSAKVQCMEAYYE